MNSAGKSYFGSEISRNKTDRDKNSQDERKTGQNRQYLQTVLEMSENETESKILPQETRLCMEVAHCLSDLVMSYHLLLYHKCFVQPFSFICFAYLLNQLNNDLVISFFFIFIPEKQGKLIFRKDK